MTKNRQAVRMTIIIIVSLIAIVYISYHIFNSVKPPLSLTAARYDTFSKSESVNGYILKDDILITTPYSGQVEYLYKDGERVSKNSVVANVYTGATEEQLGFLLYLNDVISILSECRINSNIALEEITDRISSLQKAVLNKTSEGYVGWVTENQAEIERLQSIRKLLLEGETDFSGEISLYKVQRDNQRLSMGTVRQISVEQPGYFFSHTDGYEGLLTTEKAESTPNEYSRNNAVEKAPVLNSIGSLVTDISWYYDCLMDIDQSEKYIQGSSYDLTFDGKDKSQRMLLSKKSVDRQNGKAVLSFHSVVVNEEFNMDRKTGASIVTESATGLKVSMDDVYIVDGVSCVYIFNEGVASLREVNIIFEMGGYYLVDRKTTGKFKVISLNDLVISNQKDLYDGKVVG